MNVRKIRAVQGCQLELQVNGIIIVNIVLIDFSSMCHSCQLPTLAELCDGVC